MTPTRRRHQFQVASVLVLLLATALALFLTRR